MLIYDDPQAAENWPYDRNDDQANLLVTVRWVGHREFYKTLVKKLITKIEFRHFMVVVIPTSNSSKELIKSKAT